MPRAGRRAEFAKDMQDHLRIKDPYDQARAICRGKGGSFAPPLPFLFVSS